MQNLTPKENFEFNMKRPVKPGYEIGFKDGNKENTKFANLIEVIAQSKQELSDEEKAAKEAEKEAKKAEKEAKKAEEKAAKENKK